MAGAIVPLEQARAELQLEVALTNGPALFLRWVPEPVNPTPPSLFPNYQLQASEDVTTWRDFGQVIEGGAADPGPQVRIIPLTNQMSFFRLARVADLSNLDLAGRDLSLSDLTSAILVNTDLSGADLSGSNLEDANLAGANLTGAMLDGAHLEGTMLDGANLSGIKLDNYTGDFLLTQLFGPPAEPVSLCIPNIGFNPRSQDYLTDHPDLPGVPLSYNTFSLVFRQGTSLLRANEVIADVGGQVVSGIRGGALVGPGVVVIRIQAQTHAEMEMALVYLRSQAEVKVVIQDTQGSLLALPPHYRDAPFNAWIPPYLSSNWNHDAVRSPQLWNLNSAVQKLGMDPVMVGVVDGGLCNDHPDLLGAEACLPLLDSEANAQHGTGVAGIIGASFTNRMGVEGISPFTRILCRAPLFLTAAGQRAAVRELSLEGTRVINISLGNGLASYSDNVLWQTLMDNEGEMWADMLESLSNEVELPLIVQAAGNEGSTCDARYINGPANAGLRGLVENVIVVGAIEQGDPDGRNYRLWPASCRGFEISAPGDLLSVVTCGGGFSFGVNGTSYAAPHVTGLIAYLLQLDPTLSQAEIKELILSNADPVTNAPPVMDAFAAALDLDRLRGNSRVLSMLLDIDDGTKDGNLRLQPVARLDYLDEDADNDGGPGDGNIDMADFRRWRDWFLQANPPAEGFVLDGSAYHLKKDLNGDLLVGDQDVNVDQQIQDYEREGNLFPRGDFNGDGRLDADSRMFVAGFLAGAGPGSDGQLTDLEVLMSLFNDAEYALDDLPVLVLSGDLHLFTVNLFANPLVHTVVSTVTANPEGTVWKETVHTRTGVSDVVYTVPSIPAGHTVTLAILQSNGEEVCPPIQMPFNPRPGEDIYWFPVCAGADSTPPAVQFTQALPQSGPEGDQLRLAFMATDNVDVASVTVREGLTVLGPAVRGPDNQWTLEVPVNLNATVPGLRIFSAEATDTSGNIGVSDPQGVFTTNPDQFVPTDGSGNLREGEALLSLGPDQFEPFVFRPGGRPRPGAAPNFFLEFPEGASFSDQGGETVLAFSKVKAGFESESPFTFTVPLERTGGPIRQLALESFDLADVTQLFDLNPADGLPLQLFDIFPLRWRGGSIDGRGFPGAEFLPEIPNLPLPEWSQALPDMLVEFEKDRSLRIPFSGDFELPDGSASAPTLKVGAGAPLWLTLRADGDIDLQGPVEIYWPDGQSVRAELRFDDPNYCLNLEGSGVRLVTADSLADLLPANAADCVPAVFSPEQFDQATRCLDSYRNAYTHFNWMVAGSSSNAPFSGVQLSSEINTAGAALEAWGFSAVAGGIQILPLDDIAALVRQFGHQSSAAPELPEVLAHRLALMRVKAALEAGAMSGSASAQADLDNALAEAEAAALDRTRNRDAVISLGSLKQAAKLLVDTEAIRQTLGLPNGVLLMELPGLFTRFANREADRYGIQAGITNPQGNPAITHLNRFAAMDLLRELVDVQANAQLLEVGLSGTRLEELSGQLGAHLLMGVNGALTEAETKGDMPGFILASQDFVDLAAWSQAAILPSTPELASLSDGSALLNLANRLQMVALAELERPSSEKTLGRHAHEIRALLKVLREMPVTVTFLAPPFVRAYERLEPQLATATDPFGLAAASSSMALLELLEAGILHRELGARFDLGQASIWELTRLPAVVTRLSEVAVSQLAWREFEQALRLLINAADRADLAEDQDLREAYLIQTAALLEGYRTTTVQFYEQSSVLLRAIDFVFPGEILIEDPAGYACYNRSNGEFQGAMSGRLRLPKYSLSLTVPNASFDSGGRFDVTAFGSVGITGGSLEVPARQPLHLWHTPNRGTAFEGSGRLTLDNGLRFDASVSLVDPLYCFALSARGLEFDLGKELILQRPVLSPTAVNSFNDETRKIFGDYLASLNGSLETLANAAGSFPPVDETGFGRPPEFVSPEINVSFSGLNAWSAGIIANTQAGLANSARSLNKVLASIQRLNNEARTITNTLGDEINRLANLAARLEMRRQMKQAADLAALQQLAGEDDISELVEELSTGALQEAASVLSLITPDLATRLGDSLDVVRTIVAAEGTLQSLGEDDTPNGSLPSDPCLVMTNTMAGRLQRAEALTLCASRQHALQLGLDANTGSISDPLVFNVLTLRQLDQSIRVLIQLERLLQSQGSASTGELTTLLSPLMQRQRTLLLGSLTTSPSPAVTFDLSWRLMDNDLSAQLASVPLDSQEAADAVTAALGPLFGDLTPEELSRAQQAARELQRRRAYTIRTDVERVLANDRVTQLTLPGEDFQPDFLTQLNHYWRVLQLPVPPEIAEDINSYVRFKVGQLEARPVTPEFLTNRLGEVQGLLSTVVGLTDWAGTRMPTDFSVLTNLQANLTNLTFSLTAVAEVQRAWWLLDRHQKALSAHTEIYGSNLVAGVRGAFAVAGNATLLSAQRIADAMTDLANAVEFEDVIVPLPGGVVVERIFGELCYNRQTALFDGCFGGRVTFPDVNTNLFFEIQQACLDSLGNYQIAAAMATPLPLGEAQLQTSLQVNGTSMGVATFQGMGSLTLPNPPSTNQLYQVNLSYEQAARRLALDAVGNNLDLRFGDDFVLFDAGFGFDLSLASPEGSFRAQGSAGLFARKKPLPTTLNPTNFYLSVNNLTTFFNYGNDQFDVVLSNGTFRLPDFFREGICDTNGLPFTGPQVALVPANPITVSVTPAADPPVAFSGAIDFSNIGFAVPGLTNLAVEVCSARLTFPSNSLPCLDNLEAALTLPLPQDTAVLDVTGVDWCIDGFPTAGQVALREELDLINVDGFSIRFLTNSSFGFATLTNGLEETTTFLLQGGLQGQFASDLIFDSDAGTGFGFSTAGAFSWDGNQLPTIALDEVSFAGRLQLGGPTGLQLLGVDSNGIPDTNVNSLASISLRGLTNLFDLAPDRTFEVVVSGAFGSPEFLYVGLRNASFIFDGIATPDNFEPQFQVASLGFIEGTQLALLGQEVLPFRITSGSITFLQPGLPLDQLFAPENLQFNFSGEVDISLAPPDANAGAPRLFGAVDDVMISLPDGFEGLPQFSVNTIVLVLENLTIGDMAGLTGGLAVGNLANPEELFFAGTVGGGYNGVGIKAIVALKPTGLLGLCLSVNAGPAGIPLDGGSLGGILLTGAEGGVSFLNEFGSPCDFTSYLGLAGDGTPGAGGGGGGGGSGDNTFTAGPRVSDLTVLSWDELARFQQIHEQKKALLQSSPAIAPALAQMTAEAGDGGGSGGGEPPTLPCPSGDCPPSTLNLLCQRHPSVDEAPSPDNYFGAYSERVIFKFTSLDPGTVDEILALANIDIEGSSMEVANQFADGVRDLVNALIPRAPADADPEVADEINMFIDNSLMAMRDLVSASVQGGLDAAAGEGRTPLEALYEEAYKGVPCVDVTIQLSGTFSYAPVSVALSLTGGAVASTTGTAGVLGTVNLFGLPVGTGEFFYSLTDANGNPNPSLCGGARVALGPLDLAQLGMEIGCEDCVTGMLQALANFVTGLSSDVLSASGPLLYSLAQNAIGDRIPNLSSQPLSSLFGPPGSGAILTEEEQIAVLTALLNLPELATFLQSNPEGVNEFGVEAVTALSDNMVGLILEIYNSSNPLFTLCGTVEPKIFGFSLTGGNTGIGASMFASKTNIAGDVSFSPSYVFGNLPFTLLSGGALLNVVPVIDESSLGFALGLPVVDEPSLQLLGNDPIAFAASQVNHLLANATMTFGYELNPFGFRLADGEGRIILPTLEDHPDNPARRIARPEEYPQGEYVSPSFPDRGTVLKAALDNEVLRRSLWSGKGEDLAELFEIGSPEATEVAGRELARDYFPFGGFVGASRVQLPRPITDAPPFEQLGQLFSPETSLKDSLPLAESLFNDYLLGSSEVGHLMVYVPFPRPPESFWAVSQGPQDFLDAVVADVPSLLTGGLTLYPVDQFFMRGGVNVNLLGLPLGNGELIADPAQGLFRMQTSVAQDSWLTNFVQGEVVFEIKSAPYILETDPGSLPPGTDPADLLPDARLQAAFESIQNALLPDATAEEQQAAIDEAINRITDTLPKVRLQTDLSFSVPPELNDFLRFNSGAGFYAFSPRYEPDYATPGYMGSIEYEDPDPLNPGPYTLARRNGGIVALGNFTFAFNEQDPDPNRRLVIDIPELALGVAGSTMPTTLPALNGRALIDEISLPSVFSFAGLDYEAPVFTNGLAQFNSNPDEGADYLNVRGFITPIDLGPFLQVRSLPGQGSDDGLIGSTLQVTRTATGSAVGLEVDAAQATIPMLGTNLSGLIYGSFNGRDYTPFTFSSVPGESWNATLEMNGRVEVKSPLDPDGQVLFTAEPSSGSPAFFAEINGVGLDQFELRMTLPNGAVFTVYPGTDHESSFMIGSDSVSCLFINSEGRVYYNSGTRILDLNGVATITGKVELGFEPFSNQPELDHSDLINFSAALGVYRDQFLYVTNANSQGGQLLVDAALNAPDIFTVNPHRLILGPGEVGQLRIRFTPRDLNPLPSSLLFLTNNSSKPLISIPLTTSTLGRPRLQVDVSDIDFGTIPVGTARSETVRIFNMGTVEARIKEVFVDGPFGVDRTPFDVGPGESVDVVVIYQTELEGSFSGFVEFVTSDPGLPEAQITLNGQSGPRHWYRQRRGRGILEFKALDINPVGEGIAAGPRGTWVLGEGFGESWRESFQRRAPDICDMAFSSIDRGWIVGSAGQVFETDDGVDWQPREHPAIFQTNFNWRGVAIPEPSLRLPVLVGEADTRGRIAWEKSFDTFEQASIPNGTPPLNAVAFSNPSVGVAVGENGTILYTGNGGANWVTIDLPAGAPVTANLRDVAADGVVFVVVGEGVILNSTDRGENFSLRLVDPSMDLYTVAKGGTPFYAAGSDGLLLLGNSVGALWEPEDALTSSDFRAMASDGNGIWAATRQGDIFHRSPTPIDGPLSTVTIPNLNFDLIGIGEKVVGEILVSNEGTRKLTTTITAADTNFVVSPSTNQGIDPGAERAFTLEFQTPGDGSFDTQLTLTSSDPAHPTRNFIMSATARYPDYTPLAYAALPARVDTGIVRVGQTITNLIPISNIGEAPLDLHALTVRNLHTNAACELVANFESLKEGESDSLAVICRTLSPGTYEATLEIASNARNGLAMVNYVMVVPDRSDIVRFEAPLANDRLIINGVTYGMPVAFTIVDGTPTQSQLQRDTTVTVTAPSELDGRNGRFEFQRWDPGTTNTFSFVAGQGPDLYQAIYAPSPPPGPAVVPHDPIEAKCIFDPPIDVEFGPWVKITDATVTLPWLGDGSAGSEFEAEGALFLSLTRAYGSLTSSRIRVVAPSDAPYFAGTELVEITPGSWNFDIESGFFRLQALSPGLQVMNQSTLPPSELMALIDLGLDPSTRQALVQFDTLDELPLAPGLLAMGPSSTELRIDLNPAAPSLRLALDGSLRALDNSNGGWIIDENYSLVLRTTSPGLDGVRFTEFTQLADLGLLNLYADENSRLGPVFDRTNFTFSVVADNLLLEFFNSGDYLTASASLGSDGSFNFNALLGAGLNAGPALLVPHPDDSGILSVNANPAQGLLDVHIPQTWVYSTSSPKLWLDNTIQMPDFSFSSSDFAIRIPVPAVNFAGFSLSATPQADPDNYFELTRDPSQSRINLRSRQEIFIGAMQMGFSIDDRGSLSGHLSGRIGMPDPRPLDQISDRISMSYRTSPSPEFILNRFFFGIGTRIKYGSITSPPAQGCLLNGDISLPIEQWTERLCFPQ